MNKERPILMSGPMVRAVLDSSKLQTRRVVNPKGSFFPYNPDSIVGRPDGFFEGVTDYAGGLSRVFKCPYGESGDRLWVRENFAALTAGDYLPAAHVTQGMGLDIRYAATDPLRDTTADIRGYGWRPSIHMPRWACRLVLEITDVRVERLQDISTDDALAEGIYNDGEGVMYAGMNGTESDTAKDSFRLLWESINGASSWEANPWVWAIAFKRVEAA